MTDAPTPKVKVTPTLFVANFDGRRLSFMISNAKDEMAMSVGAGSMVYCGMIVDREIFTALTEWLQQRIAEM
jgi:predicted membrane GTPase involved in stress response